jgi:hypothetical protein
LSVPLWGVFVESRYIEKAGDEFIKIAVEDQHDRDSGRIYRAVGATALDVAAVRKRYPLLPYVTRLHDVHAFVPARQGPHATLVFTGRIQRQTSEIWRRPDAIDVELEP